MKTARIKVAEFALICPACGDRLTGEQGENTWNECEYPQTKTLVCDCGVKVRVPSEKRMGRLLDREIKR